MIRLNIKFNLRWLLRPLCWFFEDHPWQEVIGIHSRSYAYCKRCGLGWRSEGKGTCTKRGGHVWMANAAGSGVVYAICGGCGERRERPIRPDEEGKSLFEIEFVE